MCITIILCRFIIVQGSSIKLINKYVNICDFKLKFVLNHIDC